MLKKSVSLLIMVLCMTTIEPHFAEAADSRERFHEAIRECIEENDLEAPQPGRPPSEATRRIVDTCLKEKGFAAPTGPPGGARLERPAPARRALQ